MEKLTIKRVHIHKNLLAFFQGPQHYYISLLHVLISSLNITHEK